MKNPKQLELLQITERPHYSLRKLSVGVASVLIGTTFYLLGPTTHTVKADTIPDDPVTAAETKAEPKVADTTTKETITDNTETTTSETKADTTKPQLATFKAPGKRQTKPKVSAAKTNITKTTPTNTQTSQMTDQVPDDVDTPTSRNLAPEQTDKTEQDNAVNTENSITDSDNSNDAIANNESNQKNKLIGKSALSPLTKKTGKEDLKNTLINGTYDHDTDTIDFYGKNTQNDKDNNIRLDQSSIGPLFNTQSSFIGSVKHIVFHNKLNLIGPANSLFDGCGNLIDITGLDNLNTSQVTNMKQMFYGCSKLSSLDLSNFDTSKVTDMYNMFNGCSNLSELDLSSFNTSKVTDMDSMFYGCSKLAKLDLSNFNTSKVTMMNGMFYNCSSLTSLDLSKFNTSKVIAMNLMFGNCSNLSELNLSNFDTSQVTNMDGMFYGCSNLSKLDLSNFDTSQVTEMGSMFKGCSSLTKLDLSSFKTIRVESMHSMFENCEKLTKLDLSNFDTSQVTDMTSMFAGCSSLTKLDLRNFNTSNTTEMGSMFADCSNLTQLDLSSFDTSQVNNMTSIFQNDTKLQVLHLGNKFQFFSYVDLPDNTWYNVGSGTLAMPEGSKSWTSAELVENYNPKTDADTYVVGSFIGSVKFHYLDQDNDNAPIKDAPAYTAVGYLDIANNKMYDNPAVAKALQDLKAKGYVLVKDTLAKDSDGNSLVTGPDEDFVFKHATQENVKANFTQDYVIHYVDANKQTVFDDQTSQRSKDTPLIVQGTYDFVTHQFLNDGKFKVIQGFDDTSYTLKNPIKKGYVADSSTADFSKAKNDYTNDALKQKTVDYFNDLLAKVPNHDEFDGTTGSVQGSFTLPDLEQTVTYTKVGHFIPVDKDGNIIPNIEPTAYQNDPNDAAKVLANQTVPTIAGMTPETTAITPKDPLADQKVVYYKTNQTTINFLDQDNNSKPIDGIKPITGSYDVNKEITKPSGVDEILKQLVAKNYELVKDPFNDKIIATEDGQAINYLFKHKVDKNYQESITGKRIIHFVDDQGQKLQDDQIDTAEIIHYGHKDLVTNKVTWLNDDAIGHNFASYEIPIIKGYLADLNNKNLTVGANDKVITPIQQVDIGNPTLEYDVVYHKVGNFIPVDDQGNPIKGLDPIPYPNDKTNAAKIDSSQAMPTIPGYQAKDKVTPTDPLKDTNATYLKNNKTIISFLDQDNNNQAISGIDPIETIADVGKPVTKPDKVKDILAQLAKQGYELVKDPFGDSLVASEGQQDLQYLFKHQTKAVTQTTKWTQTVHFVDKDGNKLASDNVQTVSGKQTGKQDQVTNKTTWNEWQFDQDVKAVKVPVVKGYLASQKTVAPSKIVPGKDAEIAVTYQKLGGFVPVDVNGKPIDGLSTISYENDPDDPTKILSNQKVPKIPGYQAAQDTITPSDPFEDTKTIYKALNNTQINFIDQDDNNQAISGIEPIKEANVIGDKIEKPAGVADIVKQLQDKGYELVTDPFKDGAIAINGTQAINYIFKHGTKKDTETVERKQTVHFVDKDGKTLVADNVQTAKFSRENTTDLVTNKVTHGQWTSVSAIQDVKVPVITGYFADQALVKAQANPEQDTEITVTYQKLGGYLPVDQDGKPIGNGKVIYENDPTDATKIKHKLPDIPGFITPNWDDPSDLTQDTKVVYQAQNTQLQVVVHDDDLNKDLPNYTWSSGKVNAGDKVDYDWAKVKEQLTNAGYEIVKEPTIPDKYSDKAQTVTIHVKHSIIDFDPDNPPKDNGTTKWPTPDKYKQTHKRVIHLVDESGRIIGKDITQEVTFKRKLKVDAVTGAILNPDATWISTSENYPEVKVPTIAGYTAKNKSKSGLDIKDDKLPSVKADMTDITDSIIYHKNGNSHWVDSDTNTPVVNNPSQNSNGSNGSNGSDNTNNDSLPDNPDNANSSVPTNDSDLTNSNKHKKKSNKTNKDRHASSGKYGQNGNRNGNHGYNNSYLNGTNVGSVANENANLSSNLPVANIDPNKLAKNAQSQLPQTGRDETDNLAIIGLAASLMGLTMIGSIKRKKKE